MSQRPRDLLVDAFDSNQMVHAYQPIISIDGYTVSHYEALLRWHHPTAGQLAPASFLALVHSAGLSDRLTDYGVALALADLPRLRELEGREIGVAVNLSHHQLVSPQQTALRIERALEHSGESPAALRLEVVEDLNNASIEPTTRAFAHLREVGVLVFLDDFGTGASSLTHLTQMGYDGIKIDRSFTAELSSSSITRAVIEAIVTFGASTGIDIVAEGIESVLDLNLVQQLGCEFGQGYFIERPNFIDELHALTEPATEPTGREISIRRTATPDVDALRDEVFALNPRATSTPFVEFLERSDELEALALSIGPAADVVRCELGRQRTLAAIYANEYEIALHNAMQTSALAENIGEWGYSAEAHAMLAAHNVEGSESDSGLRVESLIKALELRYSKPIEASELSSVDNAIGAALGSLGLWARAGAWWRAAIRRHGAHPYRGVAVSCVNLIEMELKALEGDAWYASEAPDELRREVIEKTLDLLRANPYVSDGLVEGFECRLHVLSGDLDAARRSLGGQAPPSDILGEFVNSLARAKLAKASGNSDEFLKYAARQAEVLRGHGLLSHHEQIARRMLAEAHIAAGEPEKGAAILLSSYDAQFFADARRLKSLFNWIRLHSDINTRVVELLDNGV